MSAPFLKHFELLPSSLSEKNRNMPIAKLKVGEGYRFRAGAEDPAEQVEIDAVIKFPSKDKTRGRQ